MHSATALHRIPAPVRGPLACLGLRLVGAVVLLLPMTLHGQGYSYDGNRWYEMELIVFRHLDGAYLVTERPPLVLQQGVVESVQPPAYPLRELASPLTNFIIDFDALLAGDGTLNEDQPEGFGPQPPGAAASNFRLTDFARDPWIALDNRHKKLTRDFQRMQESSSHEPLWHAVWRQPMTGAAQTPGVLIDNAAETEAERLQGSVRFTPYNETALRASISLTLTTLQDTAAGAFEARMAVTVWVLEEQREILVNTYHYFDNPAFGVLLQVRPYELPALEASAAEADF